ncbi:hypothetical protein PG985_003942 [Apiospora marii]|uniref:uncharacterized protein n=1 Tax=Apiospora marii TaxID=335849 RepID=UPI003131A68E
MSSSSSPEPSSPEPSKLPQQGGVHLLSVRVRVGASTSPVYVKTSPCIDKPLRASTNLSVCVDIFVCALNVSVNVSICLSTSLSVWEQQHLLCPANTHEPLPERNRYSEASLVSGALGFGAFVVWCWGKVKERLVGRTVVLSPHGHQTRRLSSSSTQTSQIKPSQTNHTH